MPLLQYTGEPPEQINMILPASKSESNRYLMLNRLSGEQTRLFNLSEANDTRLLAKLLSRMEEKGDKRLILDCEDAGTVIRFLLAYCAIQPGRSFRLTGTSRLLERPLQPLADALVSLGADIYRETDGSWYIKGKELQSGSVSLDASLSSQFVSALLIIGPEFSGGLEIHWKGLQGSRPYIDLTLKALSAFGARYVLGEDRVRVYPGWDPPLALQVESDWSSASYPLLAQLLVKNGLVLPALYPDSRQGDRWLVSLLPYFGGIYHHSVAQLEALYQAPAWSWRPVTLNLSDYPDLAPGLLIFLAINKVEARVYGLESLAVKESNRTAALREALAALGVDFQEMGNSWLLSARTKELPGRVTLDTRKDHRLVMAYSLLAFAGVEVELNEVSSVSKSFPAYFEQMQLLGLRLIGQ